MPRTKKWLSRSSGSRRGSPASAHASTVAVRPPSPSLGALVCGSASHAGRTSSTACRIGVVAAAAPTASARRSLPAESILRREGGSSKGSASKDGHVDAREARGIVLHAEKGARRIMPPTSRAQKPIISVTRRGSPATVRRPSCGARGSGGRAARSALRRRSCVVARWVAWREGRTPWRRSPGNMSTQPSAGWEMCADAAGTVSPWRWSSTTVGPAVGRAAARSGDLNVSGRQTGWTVCGT